MGTSFIGEVSSDRLMSCPEGVENHLSAKRHGNRSLALTLCALWSKKDKLIHTQKLIEKKNWISKVNSRTNYLDRVRE